MKDLLGFDLLGQDRRKERVPIKQSIKNEVWERAGGKCENCGMRFTRPIWDWHHKDGNPTNNKPSNILLLCKNCHWDFTRRQHTQARIRKERENKRQQEDVLGLGTWKPPKVDIGFKPPRAKDLEIGINPDILGLPKQKKGKKKRQEDFSFF